MEYNKARLFIFLSFTILLMCSCELGPRLGNIVNPPEKASSVISLHKIVKYPRAKILHRTIEGFDGIPISVNVNSFAHSKVIKKIELIERDSKITSYDLKIFFNRAGRLRWMQLSAGFRSEPMAFVIDGVFYRTFLVKPMIGEYDNDEDTCVVIKGPFDETTANELKKWAPINFSFFNDDPEAEF